MKAFENIVRISVEDLEELGRIHGTPLYVIDHAVIRSNYEVFRELLPRVQPYYAVKANPSIEIVETLYKAGASFDVASIGEFREVYANITALSDEEQSAFIWDKIIYANPIKDKATLEELNRYRPLVTFDNKAEIDKISKHSPQAGVALRLRVPNIGSMVELSSKFGAEPSEALELIQAAAEADLQVEGLCFHVGSQCTNFDNYVQALEIAAGIFETAAAAGFSMNLLDIGGGFPAPYDRNVKPLHELASILNTEFERLFADEIEILAEPGRFMVATAASLVTEVIGKARRDDKPCYYINDGIYGTYSGVLFDHCMYRVRSFKKGPEIPSRVFGPTCDALDIISQSEPLPELDIGDLMYTLNIGAYSHASATSFNGFPPARQLHINR